MAGDEEKWEPPEDYVDKSQQMRLIGLIITVVIVLSFIIVCFCLYCEKWKEERASRG